MSSNVTKIDLAAQVALLAADVEALDRGLIEAGLTAGRALARTDDVERLIGVAFKAAGIEDTEPGHEATASYSDPVVSRIEARRRRIRASGLRLISGGAS